MVARQRESRPFGRNFHFRNAKIPTIDARTTEATTIPAVTNPPKPVSGAEADWLALVEASVWIVPGAKFCSPEVVVLIGTAVPGTVGVARTGFVLFRTGLDGKDGLVPAEPGLEGPGVVGPVCGSLLLLFPDKGPRPLTGPVEPETGFAGVGGAEVVGLAGLTVNIGVPRPAAGGGEKRLSEGTEAGGSVEPGRRGDKGEAAKAMPERSKSNKSITEEGLRTHTHA